MKTICLTYILLLGLVVSLPVRAERSSTADAFSPNQGATSLVIETINKAKASIHVAAYSFTSRPIAGALVAASLRGVQVAVVLDKSQRRGKGSLFQYLERNNIPVRIDDHYAIMHNKFMILDAKVLEVGSFNYTRAAEEKNAENVLVIRNKKAVIADYSQQWNKFWAESVAQ